MELPQNTALIIIDQQQGIDHPKLGERNNPAAEIMWKFLIIMSVLFITACGTTQVHVYTSGINQDTQQRLLQSLNAVGFNAHQQAIPLPQIQEGTYIIYTPSSRSTQLNQQIEQILESLNLPAPESRLFSLGEGISSHRYTKGNIGLYVIANSIQPVNDLETLLKKSSILDWELGSTDCKKTYILDIIGDGKTYISTLDDGAEISALNWKVRNKQLVLTKLFKRYVYDISEEKKTITPIQQYPEPYGCQFRSNFETTITVNK
jgi:Tfp pilus assembly protein PilN